MVYAGALDGGIMCRLPWWTAPRLALLALWVATGCGVVDSASPERRREDALHFLVPAFDWSTESDQVEAYGGFSVAAADVNGDGFDDLVVGDQDYDDLFVDEGRVSVYFGSAAGLGTIVGWTITSGSDSPDYAAALSTGDVNSDGFDDIAVSAPTERKAGDVQGHGRVDVHLGSVLGPETVAAWSIQSDEIGSGIGLALAMADINGDGFDDLFVGEPYYDAPDSQQGMVSMYLGTATGPESTASWSVFGVESDELGTALAKAGDVNADGF